MSNWRLRAYLWFAGIVVIVVIVMLEAVIKGG